MDRNVTFLSDEKLHMLAIFCMGFVISVTFSIYCKSLTENVAAANDPTASGLAEKREIVEFRQDLGNDTVGSVTPRDK